jgi:hypothetical protein
MDENMKQLNLYFTLLILFMFSGGCVFITPKQILVSPVQIYESPTGDRKVVKPENWNLYFSERNGWIYLYPEPSIWGETYTFVSIDITACNIPSSEYKTPRELLDENIERLRNLYSLDTISIFLQPISIESNEYEILKTIVMIPTIAFEEGAVEHRSTDLQQEIDIYVISDSNNNSLMVYIYPGNNEEINKEAYSIIDSIVLNCKMITP